MTKIQRPQPAFLSQHPAPVFIDFDETEIKSGERVQRRLDAEAAQRPDTGNPDLRRLLLAVAD